MDCRGERRGVMFCMKFDIVATARETRFGILVACVDCSSLFCCGCCDSSVGTCMCPCEFLVLCRSFILCQSLTYMFSSSNCDPARMSHACVSCGKSRRGYVATPVGKS